MDIDALIDSAIAYAGSGLRGERRAGMIATSTVKRNRDWTETDKQFYLDNIGILSYRQIAEHLGRTVESVTIHAARNRMPPQTRQDGYMTANQVARLLSLDGHKIVGWMESGIMPFEYLPMEGRPIHRIAIVTLKRWLTRPVNWVYFKPARIKNPHIRRLVELAQVRWGDEWLTTRQAADLRGLSGPQIEHFCQVGLLRGIQAHYMSGRHSNPGWSYWYVRKSDVMTAVMLTGKGTPGNDRVNYTERFDAFLMKARADGKSWAELGRMMKRKPHACAYRFYTLRDRMSNTDEILKVLKTTLPNESRPAVFYGYDLKSNKYSWHVRLSRWPDARFMGTSIDKALEFAANPDNFTT